MAVRVQVPPPAPLSTKLELPSGGELTDKIIITVDRKPNMHLLLAWATE